MRISARERTELAHAELFSVLQGAIEKGNEQTVRPPFCRPKSIGLHELPSMEKEPM